MRLNHRIPAVFTVSTEPRPFYLDETDRRLKGTFQFLRGIRTYLRVRRRISLFRLAMPPAVHRRQYTIGESLANQHMTRTGGACASFTGYEVFRQTLKTAVSLLA